jgi:chemotaxis regulatin CheY-phosphate phosphatase CheZ
MITLLESEKIYNLLKEGKESEAQLFFDSLTVVGGKNLLVEVGQILTGINESILVASPVIERTLASAGAFGCHDSNEQLQYLISEGNRMADCSMDIAERIRHLLSLVESGDSLDHSVALKEIHSLTSDLMLGQVHHDLAQQLLKKIAFFVNKLETNICLYVDLNKAVSSPSGLGPSVISRDEGDIAVDQLEVDALFESGKGI